MSFSPQHDDVRNFLAQAEAARLTAERLADQLSRLQAVTAALAQATTIEDVARSVLTEGLPPLDATSGLVMLRDPSGAALTLLYASGYPDALLQTLRWLPLELPLPLCQAVREGRAVLLRTLTPRCRAALGLADAALAKVDAWTTDGSLAALPLIVDGRIIGGLGVTFARPRGFDDDDRAYLLTLARLCAQALDRARLLAVERVAQRTQAARERLAQASAETLSESVGLFTAKRAADGAILDFQLTYLNPAAYTNTTLLQPDQVGSSLLDVFPHRIDPTLFAAYCRVVEEGQPLDRTIVTYAADPAQQTERRLLVIHATKLGDGFVATWRSVLLDSAAAAADAAPPTNQPEPDTAERRQGARFWEIRAVTAATAEQAMLRACEARRTAQPRPRTRTATPLVVLLDVDSQLAALLHDCSREADHHVAVLALATATVPLNELVGYLRRVQPGFLLLNYGAGESGRAELVARLRWALPDTPTVVLTEDEAGLAERLTPSPTLLPVLASADPSILVAVLKAGLRRITLPAS